MKKLNTQIWDKYMFVIVFLSAKTSVHDLIFEVMLRG